MNSFVVDHWIKRCVSKHVSFFYIYQLPVPRLTIIHPAFTAIGTRAGQLICTTPAFDDLASSIGLSPPDHKAGVTDAPGRAKLRAELDAMVAHLYGLSEVEFAHVLGSFPLVADDVKQAALDEFKRLLATGEAATFNPDLAKPASVKATADPARAVRDLIKAGESATVEFKSTARWDVKQGKPEKFVERIIAKTVAAFLNTHGGTLVIGVQDDGTHFGLHEDYKLCGDKGRDTFEQWLTRLLLNDFGKDAAGLIAVGFHELAAGDGAKPQAMGAGDVCVVTVRPSGKPRFIAENGQEQFFVRTGNATHQLKPSEMIDYLKHRVLPPEPEPPIAPEPVSSPAAVEAPSPKP